MLLGHPLQSSKNKSVTKALRWTIPVLVIYLIFVFIYMWFVANWKLSSELKDWKEFAEISMNILLPVFTVINMIAVVRLSYEVAEYNSNNLKSQMRHEVYKEVSARLNSVFEICFSEKPNAEKRIELMYIIKALKLFAETNDHLYELKQCTNILSSLIRDLDSIIVSRFLKDEEVFKTAFVGDTKGFEALFDKFASSRSGFLRFLQKQIILI